MIYCTTCGTASQDDSRFCGYCGKPLSHADYGQYGQYGEDGLSGSDKALICLGNICISPLLGLILYFVWKDSNPQKSKDVCRLTLWMAVLWFGLVFLFALAGLIFEAY